MIHIVCYILQEVLRTINLRNLLFSYRSDIDTSSLHHKSNKIHDYARIQPETWIESGGAFVHPVRFAVGPGVSWVKLLALSPDLWRLV